MIRALLFLTAFVCIPTLAQIETVITSPLSNQRVEVGSSIFFEAVAAGNASDGAEFYWELIDNDNGSVVMKWEDNAFNYSFDEPGDFTMYCEAYNGDIFDSSPATRNITVTEEQGEPVVTTITDPFDNAAYVIGSTIFFRAEATGGSGEPYGYSWGVTTPGGGLVFFTEQSFEVTAEFAGTYIVTCRATDSDGVRADEQARITFSVVESLGVETNIVNPNGISLNLQQGETQTFTAEAVGGDGTPSFFWTIQGSNGANESFEGNPFTYTFDQPGIFAVSVAAEIDGVRDATPDQMVVNVEANQEPPDTRITEPTDVVVQIEPGETLAFAAESPNGNGDETFLWEIFFDDQLFFSQEGARVSATFDNEGGYSVTCTAMRGDLSDPTPAVRAVVVLSNDLPVETVITEPAALQRVEAGTTVLFEATATGGDGSEPEFFWSLASGNATVWEETGNPVEYTFEEPGRYVMSAFAQIGEVMDDSPATRIIDVSEGNQAEPPDTSISPSGIVSVDLDETLTISATSDQDDATFNWVIYQGNTLYDERVGEQITVTFEEDVTYEILCAASKDGLEDESPATLIVRVSPFDPDEIQTFIATPRSDISVAPGSEVAFEAYASGGTGADEEITFVWELSLDGELIWEDYDTPVFYTFEDEGIYTMSVYAEDADGEVDPTPATRLINVTSEGLTAPDTVILEPSEDLTVEAGDVVNFRAGLAAEGSVNKRLNDQVFYIWEIYDIELDEEVDFYTGETFQTVFVDSGVYEVTCLAVRQGLPDPTPAIRNVTVIGDAESVEVNIVEPNFPFSRVSLGDSLTFRAETYPEGNESSVFWEVYPSNGVGQVRTYMGSQVDIEFPLGGTYEVIATLLDAEQVVIEDDHTVDVIELEAEITQPVEYELSVAVGTTVDFTGELLGRTAGQTPQWWIEDLEDSEVVGTGTSLSYTFNEPGFYVLLFGIPGSETVSGIPVIDGRVIAVGETVPFDVALASPRDFSAFSIYETFDLRAQLFGATTSDVEITWVVEGEEFRGPLVIEDIQVDEPGDYLVEIFADHKTTGDVAEDFVYIEIYDPGEDLYAEIIRPAFDLYIETGEDVYFRGIYDDEREDEEISQTWKVTNQTTGGVVTRSTLGLYAFETQGLYEVTYQVFGEGRSSNIETRIIEVGLPQSFGTNTTAADAANIRAGSLNVNGVDGERYFAINLTRDTQDLAVEVTTSDRLIVDVDTRASIEEDDPLYSFTLEGSDSFVIQDLPKGEYLILIRPEDTEAAKRKNLSVSMSLDVAKPALFLTDVATDTQFQTTVGLLNPNNSETRMEIVAYDNQGNVLERSNRTLKANGKLATTLSTLFKTDASKISWLAINADRRICGFSNTKSRDNTQSYAVSATTALASELFVPHIAKGTQTWYTRANVINGQSGEVIPKLLTGGESYDLDAALSFRKDGFNFETKLGGTIPTNAEWARVGEQGGKVTLAGNEVFGTVDGTNQVAGLNLSDPNISNPSFTFVRRNLYFTHVAKDRNSFWTGITLVNTSDQNNTIRIEAFDDDGSSAGAETITMTPGEKRVGLSDQILSFVNDPSKVSWFVVENDGGITGYTLFGTLDTKRLAGFEPSGFLSDSLTFPISLNPEGWAGISVINPNEGTVTLDFTLYNNEGKVLRTTQKTLSAKNKFLDLIPALFNMQSVPTNAGWVSCKSSGGPVAGFQLFGATSGENMAAIKADP